MHDGALPERLGRYVIERMLGRGAMGVVYLAFDPHIARRVALKTIRRDPAIAQPSSRACADASTCDLAARFLNEARAAGRLAHPNIVAIYDYGDTGDIAYITMEYVPGESLAARLARRARPGGTQRRALPAANALRWFVQLLDALDYAHGMGIVHRDIKPANLLIAPRGECKIADFGIARVDTSYLTQSGTVLGTPNYMPPEQFTGESIDARADLFSAGVVLYEMLTGACPFTGTSAAVMQQVLNDTPAPASTRVASLPAFVDGMLAKALAKRPRDRYASAREWRDALLAGLASTIDEDAEHTVFAPPSAGSLKGSAGSLAGSPASPLADPSAQGSCGSNPPPMTRDASPAYAGWPPQLIAELEARLASYVGPVATRLLRRASAQSADVETLCARLAPHFPTEAARRDFDGLLAQWQRASSLTSQAGAPPASATLNAAQIDDATRALTHLVGPIARIIARRAATQSADLHTFHARLIDAAPTQHRDALRRLWLAARDDGESHGDA